MERAPEHCERADRKCLAVKNGTLEQPDLFTASLVTIRERELGAMGGRLSRCGLGAAFDTVVEAPADVVWETLIDIDAAPNIVSALQSIEQDGNEKVGVGTRWKETRVYNGKQVIVNVSVTHLSAETYSMSSAAILESPMNNGFTRGAASTSSFRVQPLDDKSCRVVSTFAVASNSCRSVIRNMFCGCYLLKETNRQFEKELREYCSEAIRRYNESKESTGSG